MAWYETLADMLSKVPADKVAEVVGGMQNSNETVAQINVLLGQLQRNPSMAGQISAQIIGMKGIPGIVRDYASELPEAATADPTGLRLAMKISQIQSALPRSRWF